MKQKRAKKRHSIILLSAGMVVFGIMSGVIVSTQIDINKQKKALEDVSVQYELQLKSNDDLERKINEENEEQYMERIAREKLGMVMPGEKTYYEISAGE